MSELEALRTRSAELMRENARLKDDMEVLRRGSGSAFEGTVQVLTEQRDRYHRERDEARSAVVSHVQYGKSAMDYALKQITEQTAGLPEAQKAGELPYLVYLALHAATALERREQKNYDEYVLPRLKRHGDAMVADEPLTALAHAAQVLKITGAYEIAAMIVAATRIASDDPRLICAEIMVALRRTNTLPVGLVERLPRAWIKAHLDKNPHHDTLRIELANAYSGSGTGSESYRRRCKRWLKTIEETALDILRHTTRDMVKFTGTES